MHEKEKAALDAKQVRLERGLDELTTAFWPLVRKHFPDAMTAILIVGERSDFPVLEGHFPLAISSLVLGPRNAGDASLKEVAASVLRAAGPQLERELKPKMQ